MGDQEKGARAALPPPPRKPRERKISLHNLLRPNKHKDSASGSASASGSSGEGSAQPPPQQQRRETPTPPMPPPMGSPDHNRNRTMRPSAPPAALSQDTTSGGETTFSAHPSRLPNTSSTSNPPPNSWLSRAGVSGRNRSGSVGSVETSPSSKGKKGQQQQQHNQLTLSRSTSSASNLASTAATAAGAGAPASPAPDPTRKRSNTWRRIISGNANALPKAADPEEAGGKSPLTDSSASTSTSASSSRKGQKSGLFEAFRDASDGDDGGDAAASSSPKQPSHRRSFLSRDAPRDPTPATPKNPARTLRRMGSKPLSSTSNASKDNLVNTSEPASASTSAATPGMARRASNAMERALPAWLSNSNKSHDTRRASDTSQTTSDVDFAASNDHLTASNDSRLRPKASSESLSSRISDRITGKARRASNTSDAAGGAALQVPSNAVAGNDSPLGDMETMAETSSGNEGIPKRLSGWLLNMLSNERERERDATAASTVTSISTTPSTHTPRAYAGGQPAAPSSAPPLNQKTSTTSLMSNGGPSAPMTDTPAAKGVIKSTHSTASSSPGGGGLLSNFSSSARARAAAAASLVGYNSTEEAQHQQQQREQQQNEDIWLLGVKHSVRDNNDASPDGPPAAAAGVTAPAIEVISPSPHRRPETTASETSSDRRRGARETTPSSIGSNGSAASTTTTTTTTTSERSIARSSLAESTKGRPSTVNSVTATSAMGSSFQADFSSRVWCSYRSNFVPIARDGTISKDAEGAAAALAAAIASNGSAAAGTADDPRVPVQASPPPQTPQTPSGQRAAGWLAKRLGDGTSSNVGTPSTTARSPSLGSAMGVSAPTPSSPPSNAGGPSLSEKMGIPTWWGRATAVVQATGFTGRSGLTTDAGWGCMLRTGQSLLANALIDVHLGRDWRRSRQPLPAHEASDDDNSNAAEDWKVARARYATYVRILSWFFDEPSTACPFGIHRMAREGKRLGKEVGEWFGPSTAAGAIKKLVDDFSHAGLGVNVATDGVVYLSEVSQAARRPVTTASTSSPARQQREWTRPVLILIGIRLGLEGVNPMYHDSVQRVFTFPQSVGIAGGRPSSSYYFVGYQGNSLFYLDPHNVRPAVPFKYPAEHVIDDDEWWAHVYTEAELATFHCDRPKRMPMRSLDPSMLLGFLVKDQASLQDLAARVRALPKPIFAIQNEPPRWMRSGGGGGGDGDGDGFDDDGSGEELDDPSLESFSESSQVEDDDDDDDESGDGHEVLGKNEACRKDLSPPETPTSLSADSVAAAAAAGGSSALRSAPPIVPGIQISSASSGSIAQQQQQHEFPRRRRSPDVSASLSAQQAATMSMSAGKQSPRPTGPPSRPQFPRYHSDVRFPSTGSNATARQTSGASTARQASDSYISVSESEAEGEAGAGAELQGQGQRERQRHRDELEDDFEDDEGEGDRDDDSSSIDLAACQTESSASATSASASPESFIGANGAVDMINSQVHGLAIQVPAPGNNKPDAGGGGPVAFPASTSWEEVRRGQDDQQADFSSSSSSMYHEARSSGSGGMDRTGGSAGIPRSTRMEFRSTTAVAGVAAPRNPPLPNHPQRWPSSGSGGGGAGDDSFDYVQNDEVDFGSDDFVDVQRRGRGEPGHSQTNK